MIKQMLKCNLQGKDYIKMKLTQKELKQINNKFFEDNTKKINIQDIRKKDFKIIKGVRNEK